MRIETDRPVFSRDNDVTQDPMYALHVLSTAVLQYMKMTVVLNDAQEFKSDYGRYEVYKFVGINALRKIVAYKRIADQLELHRVDPDLYSRYERIIEDLMRHPEAESRLADRAMEDPDMPGGTTHVDSFASRLSHKDDQQLRRAKLFFLMVRMSATFTVYFGNIIQEFKLFCTYEGERYRVTGASRMGDIWLTKNFERTEGYERRVFVDGCSDWGDKP